MNKPRAIIVEMDGVLSNDSARRHFIEEKPLWSAKTTEGFLFPTIVQNPDWKPIDWEAYHAAASYDPVNEWARLLIDGLDWTKEVDILIVTSRPEKYRKQTVEFVRKVWTLFDDCSEWLEEYIFMRPDFLNPHLFLECNDPKCCSPHPDNRPAPEVKREIYEKCIRDKYDVLFCLERDEDCCQMWKSLGLQVLRVI